MYGDCHIHMVLDGVYYRDAIDHQKDSPDEALIRSRLRDYQRRGITYLRDGGDRWGVGLLASQLAPEYGITYRTPVFPICRRGHYGSFIGCGFDDLAEYKQLVQRVRSLGGHFIKIMVSGLMDFDHFGVITDTPCEMTLVRDMIAVAHDAGFSVMAHANGDKAVSGALSAGVDSIEHGAYLSRDTICQLAESDAVWVPTAVTIANLRGLGRFPDDVLDPLARLHLANVAYAASQGAKIAVGSDAGAYAVYHGQGCEDEAVLLCAAIGANADAVLHFGESAIQERF